MALKCEYRWLAEPLLKIEGALPRRFFGCDSVYARGLLLLVLSDGEEPWNGAMFPVERVNHPAVLSRWPALREHPILPKWLYLSASNDRFEILSKELVAEIERGNQLFGVIPKPQGHKRLKNKGARPTGAKPKKRLSKEERGTGPRSGVKPESYTKPAQSIIPPHLQ